QGVRDGFVALFNATNGTPSWATYTGGANADKITALARAPQAFIIGGLTFSPNWVGGGFWDEWTKEAPSYTLSFGFAALWQPGAPLAPTFTAEPADRTAQEGTSVTFSAAATGTAPLFYRWQRNGVPIPGATASNYTFTAAYEDNDAAYTCTASNHVGTVTSRAALLTVIPMGTLTVSLSPTDATARGARWRIGGSSPWLASGFSTNLPTGSYTVDFKPLTGWRTPAPLTDVQLSHAATLSLQAAYTPILPEAERAISGTNVTLTVRAPAGLVSWTLTESLPPGLTPFAITGGGVWNSSARTLTFSGAEATSNTLAYSVTCTTSGLYTVTGALAVPHVSGTTPVTGDDKILSAKLLRAISGTNVTISISASAGGNLAVYENIPEGLDPANITGGTFHNYNNGQIFWYVLSTPETLSYAVSGEPGTYTLSGYAGSELIFGDSVLVIPGAEIPPPDILAFVPAAPGFFALTFTSVVNQTYAVLTNAAPGTNGWATCVAPVTGTDGTTQVQVPAPDTQPRLFFRVQSLPE
ncbi:MAG: immunoglobulin domain-containing protein, partial [Kiritimatiellae bacterium]|nr:immunoglobulin domain-containing protein [Kiritimatiellia bacterium]